MKTAMQIAGIMGTLSLTLAYPTAAGIGILAGAAIGAAMSWREIGYILGLRKW